MRSQNAGWTDRPHSWSRSKAWRNRGPEDCFRLKSPAPLTTEGLRPRGPLWSSTGVPQDNKGEARGFATGKLSVLRKHPYFADLEPEAFDQLCRYARHVTLKRGTAIASKGD